jgi:uncharacterized protein YjbI with pentapeptide repeats
MEFLEKLDVSSNSFSFEHLEANAGGVEDYFYSPQDTTYELEIIGNTATVPVGGQQLVYDWFVDGELKTGTNSPEYRIVPNEIIKCRVRSLLLPGLELWSEEFGEKIKKKDLFQFTQQEADELNKLYDSCGGENWFRNDGWPIKNEDVFEDRPHGLELQFTNDVLYKDDDHTIYKVYTVIIYLPANNLSGTIPNLSLSKLYVLDLSSNSLSGEIPNLNIPDLQKVDLSSNSLSGEIPNFDLADLYILNLSENQFLGEIPNFDLPNLTYLSLWANKLSGEIPNFDLPNLKYMGLGGNNLSGEIPSFYMQELEFLYLSGNQLTGSIPNFDMPNLKVFNLYGNQLDGEIPNFELLKLEKLSLAFNQLSGEIPNFNFPRLTWLTLSENQLSGEIPNFDLPRLERLALNGNELSGEIPNFELPNLGDLFLESNKFTFKSLEVNLGKYTKYYYQNQDTILPISQIGNKIFVTVDGSQNNYTWFLGNKELSVSSVNYYTPTEDGVYKCEVENSLLPDLVLYSDTISVVNTGIENEKSGDENVRIVQTKDVLNISTNGKYLGSEMKIFNNIGEIIYSGKMSNSDESIDTDEFASGLYNFVVMKNNRMIKSRKFVISR